MLMQDAQPESLDKMIGFYNLCGARSVECCTAAIAAELAAKAGKRNGVARESSGQSWKLLGVAPARRCGGCPGALVAEISLQQGRLPLLPNRSRLLHVFPRATAD
jgi:hypothetical protein